MEDIKRELSFNRGGKTGLIRANPYQAFGGTRMKVIEFDSLNRSGELFLS